MQFTYYNATIDSMITNNDKKALALAQAWFDSDMMKTAMKNRNTSAARYQYNYTKNTLHDGIITNPYELAVLIADNGLSDEEPDSPLLSMITMQALKPTNPNKKRRGSVVLVKWVIDTVMKTYKACGGATGNHYPPALMAYIMDDASLSNYDNRKKLYQHIASLNEDEIIRMLPDENSLYIPSDYYAAPAITLLSGKYYNFVKPFLYPLDYIQDVNDGNDDIALKLGYNKCLRIIRILSRFPLKSYGMTRKKTIETAASLDDDKFDWMISFMNALMDADNKPSIKGGITVDYVNEHAGYPVEFALEAECSSGEHMPIEYDDAVKSVVKRISAHNIALAYNLARNPFGVKPSADDLNLDDNAKQSITLWGWNKPTPLMMKDAFNIIDKLNNSDERIFDAFPAVKNSTGYYSRGLFTSNLSICPFEGFNIPQMYNGASLLSTQTQRGTLDVAKSIMHDDKRFFRWAMIECMFYVLTTIAAHNQSYFWLDKGSGLKIKTTYYNDNKKHSRTTLSPELREYMKGGKLTSTIHQRFNGCECTLVLPDFILDTMNAMPASVDEVPDGMTGYQFFKQTLENNAKNHYDEACNMLDGTELATILR